MKIDHTLVSQSLGSGQTQKAEKKKTDVSFDKVLKQQIKTTPGMSDIQSAPLRPCTGPSPAAPAVTNLEPYQRVERLLDTAAFFGQLLTDPHSNLRAIEPTLRRLESQAAAVDQLLSEVPVKNPLRQVLEEASTLVKREVARFDSGYYVDP